MAGPIQFNVYPGAQASDAEAAELPIGAFHQAVAKMGDSGFLQRAVWAGKIANNVPLDRTNGQAWRAYGTGGVPVAIVEDDAAFGGDPVFDFSQNLNSNFRNPSDGEYSTSFTLVIVFKPIDSTASGAIAVGGNAVAVAGAGLSLTTTDLDLVPKYGVSSGRLRLSRASKIHETTPNIIIACGDAATRQLAMYVNSITPDVGPTGVGDNPWGAIANGFWNVGGSSANGANLEARVAGFALFNTSLHHQNNYAYRPERLIEAAHAQYGMTLI